MATGLLGLFFAIYLLSFYGSFGVDTLSFLSFPTDTIIAAVIVLVFHYLAVYTGFRTDSIEEVSREQGSAASPV
ncbi:MAG: hypothetical protein PXY39_07255 [archaeon]|nr:hypothetical protein [archaeon]